jgi:hypothetical protein
MCTLEQLLFGHRSTYQLNYKLQNIECNLTKKEKDGTYNGWNEGIARSAYFSQVPEEDSHEANLTFEEMSSPRCQQ